MQLVDPSSILMANRNQYMNSPEWDSELPTNFYAGGEKSKLKVKSG